MLDNINIYFYTKDMSKQSARQFIPLAAQLVKKGYNVLSNFDIVQDLEGEMKIDCIPIKDYIKTQQKALTILIAFTIFDVLYIKRTLSNKANYKVVFRPRGIIPEESFYRRNSYFRKWGLDILEKRAISASDYFCFISEKQRIHFVSKYYLNSNIYNNSIVVHNYESESIEDYIKELQSNLFTKKSYSKIKIVYSGGFSKWQNVESIFMLLRDIYKNHKDILFNVYTFKENNEKAKRLSEKYEIQHITNVANLNMNEVNQNLMNNDVGIILRDNSLVNLTSSPFKVADYLSTGNGIIMTENIGDYAETLKDKAYVYFVKIDCDGKIIYDSDSLIDYLKKIKDVEVKKELVKDIENTLNMNKEGSKLVEFIERIGRIS